MWRDRTSLYISYRQSYAHHPIQRTRYGELSSLSRATSGGSTAHTTGVLISGDDDRRGLLSVGAYDDDGLSANGDAFIEMDLLPPRWADVSDEFAGLFVDIANKSRDLERLHQKHVLPGFNDEEAKRVEEGEIEHLTQRITRGFHECHKAIQRVEQMVREGKAGGHMSRAEETMAKNIQISMAGRLQEASAHFRKKQSAYLKKLRGMGGISIPSGPTATSGGATGLGITFTSDPSSQLGADADADKSFSESTLQATSHQRLLHSTDTAISRRVREIDDIAQGIIELADLFRDLQTMVIDQGTMLDRIDYNVERMNVEVKEAGRELIVASGYQRKTTKRKIMLLLLLLIVGAIIMLVVKPKRGRGSGNEAS